MTIEERNQLIEDNLKIAPFAARMYQNMIPRYDLDDVVSIASLAMVQATDSYKPDKGTYSNYMTTCIFRAINHHRSAETAETCKKIRYPLYLDREIIRNPEYGPQAFHEYIPSPNIATEEQAIRNISIEDMLSGLKPRHREIVELYYYDGYTQDELAQRYGVTSARIGQIIKASLKKMRATA